jgi:hypothetical protein
MSIQFPELGCRSYRDILDEMVSSIPKYSEKWTNHNPSDPGIMILEILAWMFDATFYRIDRLSDESYINFLRLAAGASGEEVETLLETLKNDPYADKYHKDLLEFLQKIEKKKIRERSKNDIIDMKAAALRFIQSDYRAITEENFRTLAIEATLNQNEGNPKVKRAIVNATVKSKEKKAIENENPEKIVEIIIVSDQFDKHHELIETVTKYLEPRKLICTKIIVKEPHFSSLTIDMDVVCVPDARTDLTYQRIETNIREFLDPIKGGDDKKGWVYDRALTIFELYHIIEETDGVDHADRVIMDGDTSLKIKPIDGLIHPINIKMNEMENK